jgi:hypothetical protein
MNGLQKRKSKNTIEKILLCVTTSIIVFRNGKSTYLLIDCSQSLNCALPSGVIWNALRADRIVLENSS